MVLQDGAKVSEAALREFVFDRLPLRSPQPHHRAQRRAQAPTGKIQRIGLASRLEAALKVTYEPPANEMERLVAATICDVLARETTGRNDNFFSLGGDSLRATQALTRLEQALEFKIPVSVIFRCPTPALLAAKLEQMRDTEVDVLAAELETSAPAERARLLDELQGIRILNYQSCD